MRRNHVITYNVALGGPYLALLGYGDNIVRLFGTVKSFCEALMINGKPDE